MSGLNRTLHKDRSNTVRAGTSRIREIEICTFANTLISNTTHEVTVKSITKTIHLRIASRIHERIQKLRMHRFQGIVFVIGSLHPTSQSLHRVLILEQNISKFELTNTIRTAQPRLGHDNITTLSLCAHVYARFQLRYPLCVSVRQSYLCFCCVSRFSE